MKKLVIFDLDGTIADTPQSMAYTLNQCLRAYNLIPQPVENFKFYAGDGARTMVERALVRAGDPELSLFEPVYEMYKEKFYDGCLYGVKSFDGLPEVLQQIKDMGIHMGVCTNKAHENAVRVVEKIYGRDFFDVIKGHCGDYPKKPDPSSALLIAEQFSLQPEDCLYVGDTNTDMMTGRNGGFLCVGVTWGFRDRSELEQTGADLIIDKPKELLTILKSENAT